MKASVVYSSDVANGIPTGSQKLDAALGNGIRLGSITELAGSAGAGKTQIALSLTFNTILPKFIGLIDGEVIFVTTKRNFHPLRLKQMAGSFVNVWNKACAKIRDKKEFIGSFTEEIALNRIHHQLVSTLAEMISAIYQIEKFVADNKNVRLVVIDSFSSLLRDLEPSRRIEMIYEMIFVLQSIAVSSNCAVIVTNDLTPEITNATISDPSAAQGTIKPALGEAFHHRISQRILLTKSGSSHIAHVQKNLFGGPSLVKFKITKDGVRDV